MKNNDKNNLYIISIVAIVAIVAMVFLVNLQTTKVRSVVSSETDSNNVGGMAISSKHLLDPTKDIGLNKGTAEYNAELSKRLCKSWCASNPCKNEGSLCYQWCECKAR